ncbi:MAG: hypothetical protein M3N29_03225 [Chloroflexota bacterium]|nr:hypothetical protein [Chloroflexota bacterium]
MREHIAADDLYPPLGGVAGPDSTGGRTRRTGGRSEINSHTDEDGVRCPAR